MYIKALYISCVSKSYLVLVNLMLSKVQLEEEVCIPPGAACPSRS